MLGSINFKVLESRYRRSDRKGKTKILDELCDLHGYNRKYLLQLLNHLIRVAQHATIILQ